MPTPDHIATLVVSRHNSISICDASTNNLSFLIRNILVPNVEGEFTRLGVVATEINQTHATLPQHRCRCGLDSRVALADVRQVDDIARILLREDVAVRVLIREVNLTVKQ